MDRYYKTTNEVNLAIESNTINNATNTIISTNNVDVENIWQLEIPKIHLKANISEGTTEDILNEFVGHFEDTSKENGNIGLAAHNRGYPVNYFQNLKKLEVGDEIYYTYNGKTRKYKIEYKMVIKDTDWEYLQNTEDNRITLITCVENMPEYRRCIQGIEV